MEDVIFRTPMKGGGGSLLLVSPYLHLLLTFLQHLQAAEGQRLQLTANVLSPPAAEGSAPPTPTTQEYQSMMFCVLCHHRCK